MPSLLVFFALPSEAAPFLAMADCKGHILRRTSAPPGLDGVRRHAGEGLEVWVTGVGPANASRCAEAALAMVRPEKVVTAGIAGALRPDLGIGAVVHDALELPELAAAFQSRGSLPGRIALRNRVAVDATEKRRIQEETGADLVEMESGAIRAFCFGQGIPSCTVRSVSDLSTEDLPLDFNRIYDSRMALSPGRLAGAILSRPGSIPGLIRLGRNAGIANRSLTRVLEGLLGTP